MNNSKIKTTVKKILADVHTPVGIYLRLRDVFRDTILLESAEYKQAENSYSFIAVNAIAGISVSPDGKGEIKWPNTSPDRILVDEEKNLAKTLQNFISKFHFETPTDEIAHTAQGLFGYISYESIEYFETIKLNKKDNTLPIARFRLYQYVIAFNHYKDELYLIENLVEQIPSKIDLVETLILSKDIPEYPFSIAGKEIANQSDDSFEKIVAKGISHCHRGDVFQVVLSRKFRQDFMGDDFNVYRQLRSINPSPYLFYFDYGSYRLFGSSPEAQLRINNGNATVHAIAGTINITGDKVKDKELVEQLLNDKKENQEHVMLVDLARNDLSKHCQNIEVKNFREVQYYSHLIHLVSTITGKLNETYNPFEILGSTFPAGTLSGAPKYRAMEIIDELEAEGRGYYSGAIGFIGANGSCNLAIIIRTILSIENKLIYQAGAGVVALSKPENEREEVNRKLGAIRQAIKNATEYKS